jgi:hypothetical protein
MGHILPFIIKTDPSPLYQTKPEYLFVHQRVNFNEGERTHRLSSCFVPCHSSKLTVSRSEDKFIELNYENEVMFTAGESRLPIKVHDIEEGCLVWFYVAINKNHF